jgi:hypothetical protein
MRAFHVKHYLKNARIAIVDSMQGLKRDNKCAF